MTNEEALNEVQKTFPTAELRPLPFGMAFRIWDNCGEVFLARGRSLEKAIENYQRFLRTTPETLLSELKLAAEEQRGKR